MVLEPFLLSCHLVILNRRSRGVRYSASALAPLCKPHRRIAMTAASWPEAYLEAASPEDAQGLFEAVSASASNIPGLSARQQEKKRQMMIKIMLAREKRMRHFNGSPIDVIDSPVDEPYLSPRSLPYRSADDEDTPRSSSHDGFSLAPEKAEDTEATPLELAPSLHSLRTDTLASQ